MSSDSTDSKIREAIARNVRVELARADKSKSEFAAEIFGGSRMNAWRRLSGEVPFSVDQIVRFAIWLGVPVTEIITADVIAIAETREVVAA